MRTWTARAALLAGCLFLAVGGVTQAEVIYGDSFTASNGTTLVGRAPEVSNGVAGATYARHSASWEKDIQGNQARIGADTGVSLPINSSGPYEKPVKLLLSAEMFVNNIAGPTTPSNTGLQRGIGLGIYESAGGVATANGFRGLLLGTDGRLILAQHNVAGSNRAGFLAEIATGINTAVPHTLSYEIDLLTGGVDQIMLDGVAQPDVATTVFVANTNRAGFFASSTSGGKVAYFDDFTVLAVPLRPIADLFNTGLDNGGALLGGNVDDPHYDIISQPSPGGLVDLTIPVDGFPIGPWLANDGDSQWIGPNGNDGNGPEGDYTYRTTFTLPGDAILDDVWITGSWGTDNSGLDILINGMSTGQTSGGFGGLAPFLIADGFVHGTNTLDFVVHNDPASNNPTGLRVDNLSGLYRVPEPATLSLLALGGLGLLRRRRRKR